MKGQYLTIEHVFFFAMGVTMAIMVFVAFSGIADGVRTSSTQAQLEKVGNYIRANVVEAYTAGNSTGSNVTLSLDIPTTLSGSGYEIWANGNMLTLVSGKASTNLNLYGIESTIRSKAVFSGAGKIKITYSGGIVYLE